MHYMGGASEFGSRCSLAGCCHLAGFVLCMGGRDSGDFLQRMDGWRLLNTHGVGRFYSGKPTGG